MLRTAFFFLVLTYPLFTQAQCPGGDALFKRINTLTSDTTISIDLQLKELLRFDNEMQKCSTYKDSSYAYLLRKIGILYYQLGDNDDAIQFTKKAIDVIRENIAKPFINASQITNCYYNLTLYYDPLKQDAQLMQTIDSCIEIDLRMNLDHRYACVLMEDKIRYLFKNGDYTGCIKYADLRTTLTRRYFPNNADWISFAITYKVCALLFMGDIDAAKQLRDAALNDIGKYKNSRYRGTMYNLSGVVNEYTNADAKALEDFQKGFDENLLTGYKKGCAEALTRRGLLFSTKMDRQDIALSHYKKALTYADGIDSIFILNNIANVYVKKQKFDSAFYFFQRAFNCIGAGYDEKKIFQSSLQETVGANITEYVVALIIDKGDAYLEEYKVSKKPQSLSQAISIYKIADGLLARVKYSQLDPMAKLFWSAHTHRLYEKAIQSCYLSGNKNDAFYFFEKSRAALLNDQLNEHRSLVKDDILRQAELKKQILQAERELSNTSTNSENYEKLQRSMLVAKQQLDHMNDEIKKRNPLYYQSFLDTAFVTVDIVKKEILKDHSALLEFFIGDSVVYTIVIKADKIEFFPVDKKEFDSISHSFISYISDPALLNRSFIAFVNTSQRLYEMIFKKASLPKGRIIISPDGKYLPFEAMVTSYTGGVVHYFLEDYAVTYTYSARYLLNDFATNAVDASQTFIGIAPVSYAAGLKLPSLSGSDQSLQKLEQYFSHANNLVGGQASRKNFLQQFYRYKIIQLYTHATDQGAMGEPVIYFADSALMLSDLIYENKPVTSLIVLSACQTGVGKLYRGEGVFSFNRGFASLGIPSSVSNLWQVENESTYHLTELFYKYVMKGLPFDVALQQAKLEFINDHADSKEHQLPYYWAAPVLVGQSGTIPKQGTGSWWYWLAGIALVFGLIILTNRTIQARDTKGTAS